MTVGELGNQGGVVRNPVARNAVHCVSHEVNGVATRTFVIQQIYTGRIQRTILAVRQLCTDRRGSNSAGEANPIELDVTRVNQAVRACSLVDLWSHPRLVIVELSEVST
ncbi:hypothetical protein D3C81_1929080 [compost metagenome]